MKFLLDTNICIYIIKRKSKQVIERFNTLQLSDVGIFSITVAELEHGACKCQKSDQNKAALQQFLIPLEILVFHQQAAHIYGTIRSALEKQGQVIGSLDMLIAAQAKSAGITLVTNNIKEFSRIPDLKVENWVDG